MKLLTYICSLTSPQDLSTLIKTGHILEVNHTVETLSEGWLKVDTWRCALPPNISGEELPSPEVFELGDDGEDNDEVIFSDVEAGYAEENVEGSVCCQQQEGLRETPRVEIPTFPERLSMDMFVDTVESFELDTPEDSVTSESYDKKTQMEVMEVEVEVERRKVPLGAEIFESLFIGQGGKRRWCVGDVRSGFGGRGKKDSRARGRFGDGRKRWCWNW